MDTSRDAPRSLSKPASIAVLYVGGGCDFAARLERERERFTVHTESDPRAALDRIRGGDAAFDCVVCDYDLPALGGLDVLDRVRAEFPELPFILVTEQSDDEVANEAISAGATDHFRKRDDAARHQLLAARIENAAERARTSRALEWGLTAVETARDAVCVLDEDGTVEYANAASATLLGSDREGLVGRRWGSFVPDDELQPTRDAILSEAREGRWSGRSSLVRGDGDRIEVEHTLTSTSDGSLVWTASRSDTLEERLSRRERAMDEAPIGIVLTDPSQTDNPIVYVNDEFTALTGYSRDEVLGRNCRFLQGEATDEDAVAELRAAVDEREAVTTELLNYRKDGTEFWNRVRIAPLFDDDGVIDFFVGFQDDITPRKTYEELLRSNTARLEALFEHSPDLVVVHTDDGSIRDVNQRMCEELGYSEAELVGKTVWELDPTSDPERSRSFWAGLPPNEPTRFEGALERRDGTTFPTEVHLIELNVDGEDLFVAMIRDISEQKQREAELVEQNERLDRFASVVSHDLRNPLQVAMGRLELLADDCDSDHIDDISRALDRMDDLISDLLVLAHDGNDAMDIQSVALSDLARTCWQNVMTGDATLTVETELVLDANPEQLQQLLENLFRNAVEHGSTGNQTASGDAVEHGSGDGGVAVTVGETDRGFYVEDDGVGIDPEDRDTVFEAGYTTSAQGTGFGLNIVSQIAAAHDWEVRVTEGTEGGARFEFRVE
ncbi:MULTISPECIES: PAS domain S-box protein [Haloferax]|uniref:histidine kinase n=6 Tax=Haloferax TaxID=2251 RepID=A0A6C0UU73_HALVO|nr:MULTISPECIES: PAS domain S-box protein [Haloferax]ELZ75397.1 HTR-like protein [Haloferax lucentense DSM 14919]ELZ87863.1 HTR-like protein [Haloferax alexandrinus JCM 10717]MBC9986734.1 PAS domain S-box protein [Haloferax sp. AS1]NLV03581.1 PAS domain S-box protein [Haloferax alexandrinus]QIB79032.1 PAS domain S-box protein [Haloferax alexandrinus]